jgi:hypothetical protein
MIYIYATIMNPYRMIPSEKTTVGCANETSGSMIVADVFWTNTVWYLALFVISAACVAAFLRKAGNRRFAFAFFLSIVGLIYIMEHIIVVYLDAYQYHPGISGDPAIENMFGNIFSQTSIAAAAMVLIVYDLSFAWSVVFAAAYFPVEILFSCLGLFEQHWYRAWFTPVILIPLFRLFRIWYRSASVSRSCLPHRADLFLSVGTASYHMVSIPFLLFGIQWMRIGLFPDAMNDHRAVTLPFGMLIVAATILLHKWKGHWVWKSLGFGMLFAYQYALYLLGIFIVRDGWFIPVALAYIVVCWWLVRSLDLWHKSGNPNAGIC